MKVFQHTIQPEDRRRGPLAAVLEFLAMIFLAAVIGHSLWHDERQDDDAST